MAEDPAAKEAELQALRQRIQRLQSDLEAKREQQGQLRNALRDSERDIGRATAQLRDLGRKLTRGRARLEELRREQQGQIEQLDNLRERLARDARGAYAMGRQEQVKLLLNQEQPAAVGRMITYYGYFAEARAGRIEAVHSHLARLEGLQQEIGAETRNLERLRVGQQAEADRLRARQRERQRLLSALQQEIQTDSAQLDRLVQDERQLQELIRSLQEMLADIPLAVTDQRPFHERKGALQWPVQGSLLARFGSRRAAGELQWKGVLIGAPAGTEVRAVSHGRVAFADWLRGFGLLLIIDHGAGYMTLYGHNQSLYKEVGEWVDTGEVIATVGDSGGQSRTGLYFEVRNKGRPVNPVAWCAGKGPSSRRAGS